MKTYIIPKTLIIEIAMHSALMQMSSSDNEISEDTAGLVKEDNSIGSSKSIWDDDWND